MHAPRDPLAGLIGARIRAARKSAGLTLVQVAERSGLSQPFLSQAENGRTMVSVGALHRIASALGTSARTLLGEPDPEPAPSAPAVPSLVRADEGRTYELADGARLRYCVTGSRTMDITEVTAAPGCAADGLSTHAGEEGIRVLEGGIRVEVGGEVHEIRAGDTLYYAASTPHRWSNAQDVPARFLFITSPPGY